MSEQAALVKKAVSRFQDMQRLERELAGAAQLYREAAKELARACNHHTPTFIYDGYVVTILDEWWERSAPAIDIKHADVVIL